MTRKDKIWTFISGILLVIITTYFNSYYMDKQGLEKKINDAPTKEYVGEQIKIYYDKNFNYIMKVEEKGDANNKVITTSLADIKTSLRSIEVYMRKKK